MRPRSSFVLALTVMLFAAPASANDEERRVRAVDRNAAKVLEMTRQRSATARAMLDRLETSDMIVYVQFAPRFEAPRAVTTILTTAGRTRYVLISITTLAGDADRFLLLGHELQHAVELAEAPHVTDREGMTKHYERIGWRDRPNVYETYQAQEAGRAVRKEMFAARPESVVAAAAR